MVHLYGSWQQLVYLAREDEDLVVCLQVEDLVEVADDLAVLGVEALVGEVLEEDDKSLALTAYSYMVEYLLFVDTINA